MSRYPMLKNLLFSLLVLASPLLLQPQALAAQESTALAGEQKQRVGDYDVHYSAFNSTFLPTQVARSYGISRSRYTAVLNISVHDTRQSDSPAVDAEVTGNARNLLGITKPLTFRRVQEGAAIYYLAQISFANEETYRFTLDIQPPEGAVGQVKFQQKFYAD